MKTVYIVLDQQPDRINFLDSVDVTGERGFETVALAEDYIRKNGEAGAHYICALKPLVVVEASHVLEFKTNVLPDQS